MTVAENLVMRLISKANQTGQRFWGFGVALPLQIPKTSPFIILLIFETVHLVDRRNCLL